MVRGWKKQPSTPIKLHQVHSLARNIPISNQSFEMGYRYIWRLGSGWGWHWLGQSEGVVISASPSQPSSQTRPEHEGCECWTPNLVLIVVDLTYYYYYYYRQSSTMWFIVKVIAFHARLCRKQPSFTSSWLLLGNNQHTVCVIACLWFRYDGTWILPFYFPFRYRSTR